MADTSRSGNAGNQASGGLLRTLGRFLHRSGRDYGKAKTRARSPDAYVRRDVALRPDVQPELLYFLARDVSPVVRAAVAAHPKTPRQADLNLALDEVPEIRLVVAEKVTNQINSIGHDEGTLIWQLTVAVLEALARDDISRVRQLVAETARGLAKMPAAVATTLARDRVPAVAVSALNYPGQLADQELVEIVRGAPDPSIVGAVARRPAIGAAVADAVVAQGDDHAIGLLLYNKTADIQANTLNRVIDRAAQVPSWHEALVTMPMLSQSTAVRLAGFVADALIKLMEARPDLDRATVASIGQAAQERRAHPATAIVPVVAELVQPDEDPVTRARRLHAAGELSEDVLVDALGVDLDFLIAALSLRSRLPPAVVAKLLASQSAKGLTSLAWLSGYSMRLALQLQLRIGHLPPKARLTATSAAGWPLTQEEMEWQIEFFRTLVSG